MIYRFKITSPENTDFLREIEIGYEQTWLDLHNAIQKSVGYDNSQMASFYQIDSEGERGLEIALFEMNTEDDDDMNVVAMDVAMIREFVSKDNPDLIYVFDFFSDRFFNVKLTKKGISQSVSEYPVCIKSKDNAPEQIMMNAENFDDMDFSQFESKSKKRETADDYLIDFEDEFNEGQQFENLDDYDDIL